MPFNIPNLLTWLRIALIPLFVGVFYFEKSWVSLPNQNLVATAIFVLAGGLGALTLPPLVAQVSDVFENFPRSQEKVAQALEGHPAVRAVDHPGLASHRSHALAVRLFEPGRYGAVVTVTPYGGRQAGMALVDGLQLVQRATSLGGTVSKAVHVATTTHKMLDEQGLLAAGIDPGAVRVSIGLEDATDLVADLVQALARVTAR